MGKALIHAGVVAYARPFSGGVRGWRGDKEYFSPAWTPEVVSLHEYLYSLRDKHVAHSVNAFERATACGVVVLDQSLRLVDTNPSGVGLTKLSMVGLPMAKLRACGPHT